MSNLLARVLEMPTEYLGREQDLGHARAKTSDASPSKGGLSGHVGPVEVGALPSEYPETGAGLILDGHIVKEILSDTGHTTWIKDIEGKVYRYFTDLDQSFPVEIVRPGDPAVCTVCGQTHFWLPFPALANVCRDCQPLSLGWIPDPGKPRFEGGLEFRSGPACRACGTTERYRRFRDGPWVCPTCHAYAKNDMEEPIPPQVWSAFGTLLGMTILRKEGATKEPDVSRADGERALNKAPDGVGRRGDVKV